MLVCNNNISLRTRSICAFVGVTIWPVRLATGRLSAGKQYATQVSLYFASTDELAIWVDEHAASVSAVARGIIDIYLFVYLVAKGPLASCEDC
jgi:hypothetical protein